MDFVDEMLKHFFRHGEIGDNTVFQWANCLNIARCTSKHVLGFQAHCSDILGVRGATFHANGDYGGFIQNDAFSLYIYKCVGRS